MGEFAQKWAELGFVLFKYGVTADVAAVIIKEYCDENDMDFHVDMDAGKQAELVSDLKGWMANA